MTKTIVAVILQNFHFHSLLLQWMKSSDAKSFYCRRCRCCQLRKFLKMQKNRTKQKTNEKRKRKQTKKQKTMMMMLC